MSHKKFGPDRFCRFDVYWIQTNRQTDKPNLYIDIVMIQDYKQDQDQVLRLKLKFLRNYQAKINKCIVTHKA